MVTTITIEEGVMRFESFLWTLLAGLLLLSAGVEGTAPITSDGGQFAATDGGNEVPPPGSKP